jgi:hypothetical protein
MATNSHEHPEDAACETVEELASAADDGAAQLAMAIESIADELEMLARRLAEIRADVSRERVLLTELRTLVRRRSGSRRRLQIVAAAFPAGTMRILALSSEALGSKNDE